MFSVRDTVNLWKYGSSRRSTGNWRKTGSFPAQSQIAGRLVDAGVDKHVRGWEKASDNAPVWIELADEGGGRKAKKVKPSIALDKKIAAAETGKNTNKSSKPDVPAILKSAPKTRFPANIKPMKATLVDEPFDDPGWIYEIKWDGYRAIAKVERTTTELISRNNLPFD